VSGSERTRGDPAAGVEICIQRLGGLAGLGSPRSRLKSEGAAALSDLSAAARRAVEHLFTQPPRDAVPPGTGLVRDAFTYRLTRRSAAGAQTVEVAQEAVPPELIACIRDELQ
jgi:hypothetical protein